MKILLLHNRYQLPGGEDAVVQAEMELLQAHGNQVRLLEWNNAEINGYGSKLRTGLDAIYSVRSRRRVERELGEFMPDLVHIHNFFPLISPSAYFACAAAGVPVVQTLHNYRLLCPSADFFRNGNLCEECLKKSVPWPGLVHGCYRESRVGTVPVAAMLMTNRALGTFEHKVRAYVALTEFSRLKFIEGGLPEEKLFVKPNFLMRDPGLKSSGGDYAVFAGRLSEQKGLHTLLAAMARIPHIPIILAGDGPLFSKIKEQIDGKRLENVKLTGWLSPEDLRKKMRNARFLVMPSRSYENFPLNVLEAFAMGLPVVCSRLGAMKELVQDAFTGFHFEAGNPIDLAEKMLRAWDHDALKEIGRNARVQFERKYTADRNYEKLMAIYECALHGSLAGSAMQATVAS